MDMAQRYTGKRPQRKTSCGFTLIELIVTIGILSFGIVTIYEALFISMDTFGFYTNYLETQDWIDEKIAEKNDELTQAQRLEAEEASGQIVRDQRTFYWTMMVSPIDEYHGLYRVDVVLSWNQGSKKAQISRVAYLLPPQLKIYEEIPA
jgi:prepilin-type N-terminal cleavage/methylation domain-containing protein